MIAEKEVRLLEQVRDGDQEAFEILYRTYEKWVFRSALKLIGNYDDACDVAQNVWIRVHRQVGAFERRSRFSTWLYRAVVNACIDLMRRRRAYSDMVGRFTQTYAKQIRSVPCTATAALESWEAQMIVSRLLERLPESQRAILVARELCGCSMAETAQLAGVPVGTIKSRLYRAHRRLRQEARRLNLAG